MFTYLYHRSLFQIALFVCCQLLNSDIVAADKSMLGLERHTSKAQVFRVLNEFSELAPYEYGEVTINNLLTEPMVLRYKRKPSAYFIPLIRNGSGELVSSGQNFGVSDSMVGADTWHSQTIAPGASSKISFHYPLETVPDEKRKPGVYYFRVQFRYDGKVWESNEIEINHK